MCTPGVEVYKSAFRIDMFFTLVMGYLEGFYKIVTKYFDESKSYFSVLCVLDSFDSQYCALSFLELLSLGCFYLG